MRPPLSDSLVVAPRLDSEPGRSVLAWQDLELNCYEVYAFDKPLHKRLPPSIRTDFNAFQVPTAMKPTAPEPLETYEECERPPGWGLRLVYGLGLTLTVAAAVAVGSVGLYGLWLGACWVWDLFAKSL